MGMIYRLHDVRLEPEGRVQDLCLRDGRLEECAGALPGVEIEGNGGLLLPGMIDPHVHLRTPGMEAAENWDTGTRGRHVAASPPCSICQTRARPPPRGSAWPRSGRWRSLPE